MIHGLLRRLEHFGGDGGGGRGRTGVLPASLTPLTCVTWVMQSAERDLRINALLKAALHHKTFELNLVVNLNARAAILS